MKIVHARGCGLVLSRLLVLLSIVAGIAALNPAAMAQYGNPLTENGFKPFGSFDHTDIDSVNLVNLKLNLHIPLRSYPQRGKMFPVGYHVAYENNTITQNIVKLGCGNFRDACPGPSCSGNCMYILDVNVGTSVNGGLTIESDDGFSLGGPSVYTADGAMHEMAGVQPLGGTMTLDASGFYDSGTGSVTTGTNTLMRSDGVRYASWWNYTTTPITGGEYYGDITGNNKLILEDGADTIGRTLPKLGDFDYIYPPQ